jgi:multidrug efflux pump subunit AcrA (membrane-fusion protein)
VKALAAILLCAACHGAVEKQAGHAVTRTAVVTRGDLDDRVLLTGDLRAPSSVDLTSPRTDTWMIAIRWLAKDGAEVKAGDRVLEFDNTAVTSTLEQKKLQLIEAEMAYRSAKDLSAIETENKKNALDQHRVALEKARVRADVPEDLVSKREFQERQLAKKQMEAEVKKAEGEFIAQGQEAKLDLEVKQIELDKAKRAIETAEKTISDLVLKAPKDGVVVIDDHPWEGRKFHENDQVQPGWAIVSMPDITQPMEVRSQLSDVDDGRVTVGMSGSCTLDAYPADPIACTVLDITPVARPTKNEGSQRREFAVRLSLAKTDPARMRPGMSVKISLPRPSAKAALLVPRGAVLAKDVRLGACDAQHCVVESGLREGETVTLEGGS